MVCSIDGAAQRKKDDKPKAGDGPPALAFEAKEIAAATRLVAGFKGHERVVFDALRYIMRPTFQDELFKGRSYHPCPLPPFDADTKGDFTVEEKLRLHALLTAGVPWSVAMQQAADRLVASPLPAVAQSLGLCGLELLILRDLGALTNIQNRDKLMLRAREVLKAADNATTLTAAPEIQPSIPIQPRWFFNHFWRQAIARLAVELEMPCNDKLPAADLDVLLARWDKERGFSGGGDAQYSIYSDGDPNMISFATLSLALELPDKLMPRARKTALLKQLEGAPAILKKFAPQLDASPEVTLALLRNHMKQELAPEGERDPAAWRTKFTEPLLQTQRRNGAFAPRGNRVADTGWVAPGGVQEGGATLDTVLMLDVLAGGLFAKKRLIKGLKSDELNKAMRALALLEAVKSRVVSTLFRERVITAIADGCEFLAQSQKDDGQFRGQHASLTSHQALVMLTLLHGGAERDSAPIKKGLAYLDKQEFKVSSYSYDAAVSLMFFQKYYEPEIKAAGMLSVAAFKDRQEARKKLLPTLPPERVKLFARLLGELDSAFTQGEGGWGYSKVDKTGTSPYTGVGDSSNTQYAMLGYRAAVMLGCEVKTSMFLHEAERLVKHFFAVDLANINASFHRRGSPASPDRSAPPKVPLPEEFKGLAVEPGGWGYTCNNTPPDFAMTAAGVSSLAICMDELRLRGELTPKLEQDINRRIAGALMYMRHEFHIDDSCRAVHAATGGAPLWDGCGFYYDLYSTERACELLKLRELPGEFDWYRVGAELLCYSQEIDGSWKADNVTERTEAEPAANGAPAATRNIPQSANICMAILFLKRAAMPILTDHRRFDKSKPRTEEEDPAKAPPKKPITGEKMEKPAEGK
ncbi:MAG: hypothetical protein KBG84_03560 [Planctomycetes bacterium]|nr:hypothetical protein [Planctomycetota bacterium]